MPSAIARSSTVPLVISYTTAYSVVSSRRRNCRRARADIAHSSTVLKHVTATSLDATPGMEAAIAPPSARLNAPLSTIMAVNPRKVSVPATRTVGLSVGLGVLGDDEGRAEGIAVGPAVGHGDGLAVGDAVGSAVGDTEGTSVGDADGNAVGYSVGRALGAAVGPNVEHSPSTASGAAHDPVAPVHVREPAQSAARQQPSPASSQGAQSPPQSVDVSDPFCSPSTHDASVGEDVGRLVGLEVGDADGSVDGDADGKGVGEFVGTSLGEVEGRVVGALVGASVTHAAPSSTLICSAGLTLCLSAFHCVGGSSSVPYQAQPRFWSPGKPRPSASNVLTTIAKSSASSTFSLTFAVNSPPSAADVGASIWMATPLGESDRAPPASTVIPILFFTVLISSRASTVRLKGSTTTGVLSLANSAARTSTSHPSPTSTSALVSQRYFAISIMLTNLMSTPSVMPFESTSISASCWSMWPGFHLAVEPFSMMRAL